jgi:hypothetical protein
MFSQISLDFSMLSDYAWVLAVAAVIVLLWANRGSIRTWWQNLRAQAAAKQAAAADIKQAVPEDILHGDVNAWMQLWRKPTIQANAEAKAGMQQVLLLIVNEETAGTGTGGK